jgi:hypothetical protein
MKSKLRGKLKKFVGKCTTEMIRSYKSRRYVQKVELTKLSGGFKDLLEAPETPEKSQRLPKSPRDSREVPETREMFQRLLRSSRDS